mmetsp:Transcript_47872/g.86375  ORF Transcript_47872/g.86375 Transcript_47872/m.86375 type:complete len:211 (+) Transcript_47872:1160-1792(+)
MRLLQAASTSFLPPRWASPRCLAWLTKQSRALKQTQLQAVMMPTFFQTVIVWIQLLEVASTSATETPSWMKSCGQRTSFLLQGDTNPRAQWITGQRRCRVIALETLAWMKNQPKGSQSGLDRARTPLGLPATTSMITLAKRYSAVPRNLCRISPGTCSGLGRLEAHDISWLSSLLSSISGPFLRVVLQLLSMPGMPLLTQALAYHIRSSS